METKRRALGKGLEQLFNSENLDLNTIENRIMEGATKDEIVQIKLTELRNNPYQPRKVFDEVALEELAHSIEENGVFQPIIVKKSIKGYEIIAGERRVRASIKAGLDTIPAIVRELTDEQMMQIALLENLQRENLTAIEEAEAFQSIIKLLGITQEELSRRIGKSRSHVNNMIGLLRLPKNVRELVLSKKISMGHARVLSKLDDETLIENLAFRVVNEDLSVRQLETIAANPAMNRIHKTKKKEKQTEYQYIQDYLSDKLGTKVSVSQNKVQIQFESSSDLTRILDILHIKIDE